MIAQTFVCAIKWPHTIPMAFTGCVNVLHNDRHWQ
jgi:hypothetical protein